MNYDLLVIGGGPGGYVAAIRGSQNGLKVGLVEKEYLGGTCLNAGCIPTKVYAHAAAVINEIKHSNDFGIEVDYRINLDGLRAKKQAVVKRMTSGVQYLLKKNKVDVIYGEAKFVAESTVIVDNVPYTARNFIIATGSKIAIPPIKGVELPGVIDSNQALNLDKIPGKVVIVGAGVIGLEFANIYQALGSEVILVEMLSELLPMLDRDMALVVSKNLQAKNIRLVLGCKVLGIESGLHVKIQKDGDIQDLDCDSVLLATGRVPNLQGTEALNLEKVPKGIKVNNNMQTSVAGIYCIGDVNGLVQLAHAASYEGEVAVENILGNIISADFSTVPGCIYSDPEIAWVGLNETQAAEKYSSVHIGSFPYSASGRAVTMGGEQGMVKIITIGPHRKIVGMQIIGTNATELIHQGVIAIKYGFSAEMAINTIYAHPTLGECVKEAYEDVMGRAIHKG